MGKSQPLSSPVSPVFPSLHGITFPSLSSDPSQLFAEEWKALLEGVGWRLGRQGTTQVQKPCLVWWTPIYLLISTGIPFFTLPETQNSQIPDSFAWRGEWKSLLKTPMWWQGFNWKCWRKNLLQGGAAQRALGEEPVLSGVASSPPAPSGTWELCAPRFPGEPRFQRLSQDLYSLTRNGLPLFPGWGADIPGPHALLHMPCSEICFMPRVTQRWSQVLVGSTGLKKEYIQGGKPPKQSDLSKPLGHSRGTAGREAILENGKGEESW